MTNFSLLATIYDVFAAVMLFGARYSFQGWLCVDSIRKFHPCLPVYILCLDERVYWEAKRFATKDGAIKAVRLYELENARQELWAVRSGRRWDDYVQTCKVFLARYIFETHQHVELLFYCDADMLFWGSPEHIYEALGDHSFMATSVESRQRLPQGVFNSGFYACRNDSCGLAFMRWWEAQVLDWCEWKADSGRFGDQGYLNVIEDDPKRFAGAIPCPNPGINMTHWTVKKHRLERVGDGLFVDQWPLVCYHYLDVTKNAGDTETLVPEYEEELIQYLYSTYKQRYTTFRQEHQRMLLASLP